MASKGPVKYPDTHPELNGRGRQKCKHCAHRSIAGMVKGEGRCPYHWAVTAVGKDWANKCYPNYGKVN